MFTQNLTEDVSAHGCALSSQMIVPRHTQQLNGIPYATAFLSLYGEIVLHNIRYKASEQQRNLSCISRRDTPLLGRAFYFRNVTLTVVSSVNRVAKGISSTATRTREREREGTPLRRVPRCDYSSRISRARTRRQPGEPR